MYSIAKRRPTKLNAVAMGLDEGGSALTDSLEILGNDRTMFAGHGGTEGGNSVDGNPFVGAMTLGVATELDEEVLGDGIDAGTNPLLGWPVSDASADRARSRW